MNPANEFRTPCEQFGHVYEIVDSSGDEETHRCADCGDEYTD